MFITGPDVVKVTNVFFYGELRTQNDNDNFRFSSRFPIYNTAVSKGKFFGVLPLVHCEPVLNHRQPVQAWSLSFWLNKTQ